MRTASAALQTLLTTQTEYLAADLLTFVPVTGSVVRLTSAQQDLTVASRYPNVASPANQTFLTGRAGAQPRFTRGATKLVIGTQVDHLTLTIEADPLVHTYAGVPWPAAARAGIFDGATVCLEKFFTQQWSDVSPGTIILFRGKAGEIKPTRSGVIIEVVSDFELFVQQAWPRNAFQAGCLHTLYDTGCTLNPASFAVSGSVSGGISFAGFNSNLTNPDGYFNLGKIVFTSGPLNGFAFTVKTYLNASGVLTVLRPFPILPVGGNTFTAYPGCDKQQATCSGKFSNLAHFRGYPYVPTPENAR